MGHECCAEEAAVSATEAVSGFEKAGYHRLWTSARLAPRGGLSSVDDFL